MTLVSLLVTILLVVLVLWVIQVAGLSPRVTQLLYVVLVVVLVLWLLSAFAGPLSTHRIF